MTNQELATCALEGIPDQGRVINNQRSGMVRQWQTLFYEGRYSQHRPALLADPGLRKLAEAYGCVGLRCDKPDDVDAPSRRRWRSTTAGRGRLRRAPRRDGVADGRRRHQQRRHQGRPRHGTGLGPRGGAVSRHTLSVLVENTPGAWPGSRACSPAAASTSTRWRSARPSIRDLADDDRRQRRGAPLEQVTKQLNKLVNVIKIVQLDPSSSVRRELLLVKVRAT
jgi:hypothetical protein